MKVAGFIAKRIAFNQQRSFSRFIIRLSVAATVISVAVMVITLSFANGFQATVSQKVFSFWGHVRIQDKSPDKAVIAEETPITANENLLHQVRQQPNVESAHAFATKYALLKSKEDMEGVLLKGFDSSYHFSHLRPFILEGRPPVLTDTGYSREIMISATLAKELRLKLNDRPFIYVMNPGSSSEEEDKIRTNRLTVCGIYKTGIEEYDKTFAIADIRLIRKLYKWSDDQIGGYEIFLHDYKKTETAVQTIYELPSFPATWNTVSVKNISPNIFDWLAMQDVTRNVLIGFMVIVAVINLITCLIILVLERVRMVGVLKALGATDWTVQLIFLRHAMFITVTGILAGLALGLGVLYLQQYTGFIKLNEDAYYMPTAAVEIIWWQVGLICLMTFVICVAVLMIPTLLIRKVQPVSAIRFR